MGKNGVLTIFVESLKGFGPGCSSEKFNTEKYKYINIFYFYSVVLPPLSFCLGPELAYSNLFTKHTAAFNLN